MLTQTQTTDEPDGGIDILDDGVRLSAPGFVATYKHPEGFSGVLQAILDDMADRDIPVDEGLAALGFEVVEDAE